MKKRKLNANKVLESWEGVLSASPFNGMLDGENLPADMLPITINITNMRGAHELDDLSEHNAVPVTYHGKIVGTCIRGTIEFFDCAGARAAISYINGINGFIGISSRSIGTINEDGSITKYKEIEKSIIDKKNTNE